MNLLMSLITRPARFFAWLLAPERLDTVAPEPAEDGANARRGFVRWLLAAETLPCLEPEEDSAIPRRPPSGRLFANEKLPSVESVGVATPSRSFVRWLFTGESLVDAAGSSEMMNVKVREGS